MNTTWELILLSLTAICLLMPGYVYAGYPFLLWLSTRLKKRHAVPALPADRSAWPSVTLIVSCYNEASVIRGKLENSLELDYPKDRLTIVAVSDGSDDGTDDIIQEFQEQGVQLLRQEGRLGKTMGVNLAMETITSDLVVFSDANALYVPDAIQKLARHFASPDVGYVVGSAIYTDGGSTPAATIENLYWRYELAMKAWEGQLHSVVGGDGAIYAIRRTLWEPLQQRDINDFVNPLQIIAKGYHGRFEEEAQCFEETAGSFAKEVNRKERIANRGVRGLMRVKSAMNPKKTGIFSFMLISHKLLRWMTPFFLVLGVAGSAALSTQGMPLFQLITAGSLSLVLLATVGHIWPNKTQLPMPVSWPYYFVMVNAYAMKGLYKATRGETQIIWNSARPNDNKGNATQAALAPSRSLLLLAMGVLLLSVSLGLPYV